ncbi:MAG: CpsD/CapB family tyrosine-protein kinase [Clostridia bacterium]|nr:CpsD/CapB family tyrosine-protein kinase [Clostridia bacterium]
MSMDNKIVKEYGEAKESKVPFAVAEAYKSIRTNIMFLLTKKLGNVITVSGSDISEGKSTTSVNLAIAFSQLGDKVLLIDADLRRSSIHKKTKLENEAGLSDILGGFTEFDKVVKSVNPFLDVLTSGHAAPNPSELLGSARFESLIEGLKDKYNYIIIDTPPVNVVTDALIVAPKSDGVVLVVRDKFTMSDALKKAIESFEFANVKVLGAIMNAAGSKKGGKYYKKYHKSYNYKYGYKY